MPAVAQAEHRAKAGKRIVLNKNQNKYQSKTLARIFDQGYSRASATESIPPTLDLSGVGKGEIVE